MSLKILGAKDNPQYFETVAFLFEQLNGVLTQRETFELFSEDSIYETVVKVAVFKDFNNFLELNFHLALELKTNFLQYKEAKLQDRYGNFIANPLINYMIPVYEAIKKGYEETPVITLKEGELSPDRRKNLEHRFHLFGICLRLFEWIDTICMNLQIFTPELYESNYNLFKTVKPIIADLPSIRPTLPVTNSEVDTDNNIFTVRTIEPVAHQRPKSDYTICLDQVRSLSHNSTFLLSFSGFTEPTSYSDYVLSNVPQLLDESFCNGLNNGLNTEIRNNFMRFTESKVQDRYATDLIRVLDETLNPALNTFDSVIEHLSLKNAVETQKYSANSKELFTSIEFNHYQKEINGLIGPNIRVRTWRDTIEQFLSDYTPEHYNKYKSKGSLVPDTNLKFIESQTKLQWKGDKTDLAELVWALSKSGRITDISTMKDVTQKELAEQIAALFGLDSLDVVNLMKGRYGTKGKSTTYKAQDGKTFVNTLQTLLTDRILD